MNALESIETSFRDLRESGSLELRFASWGGERHGLACIADFEGLIALCRDSAPDPRKDAALAALCVQARTDHGAGVALCWLLLPGLWDTVRELPAEVLDQGDMAAELLAGLWAAASAIDENACEVAARLVNGARWGAQRAIRKAMAWNARIAPGVAPPDRAVHDELDDDLLSRAVAEAVVSDDEIEILLARRSEIPKLARRHGVSVEVLQARRKRARTRLAAWVKRVSRDLHAWERPAER
ncbi:MAG: hypothetical protein ACRDKS_04470 [Actinomycetota bacterium]